MIVATWHSGKSMHPAASRNGHHRFDYGANLAGKYLDKSLLDLQVGRHSHCVRISRLEHRPCSTNSAVHFWTRKTFGHMHGLVISFLHSSPFDQRGKWPHQALTVNSLFPSMISRKWRHLWSVECLEEETPKNHKDGSMKEPSTSFEGLWT